MPDSDDQHDEHGITNRVDNAIVALADAISVFVSGELFDPDWPGIINERVNYTGEAYANILGEAAQLFTRGV